MTKTRKLFERIKAFFRHEYIVIPNTVKPVIIKVPRQLDDIEFVDPTDDILDLDFRLYTK